MLVSRSFFLILVFVVFQAVADNRSLLSGQWKWLPDESDDPRELIAESLEFIDVAAFQAARAAGHAAPVGAYRRRPARKQVDSVFRFFDTVVPMQPLASIEHREPWMKLIYTDGREREIYTDGRDLAASVQTTAARQDQKLQFASWEGNVLVVETNTSSGVSVLESYSLGSGSGKDEVIQLQVEIAIDSARLPDMLRFNSVYRSAAKE